MSDQIVVTSPKNQSFHSVLVPGEIVSTYYAFIQSTTSGDEVKITRLHNFLSNSSTSLSIHEAREAVKLFDAWQASR